MPTTHKTFDTFNCTVYVFQGRSETHVLDSQIFVKHKQLCYYCVVTTEKRNLRFNLCDILGPYNFYNCSVM